MWTQKPFQKVISHNLLKLDIFKYFPARAFDCKRTQITDTFLKNKIFLGPTKAYL